MMITLWNNLAYFPLFIVEDTSSNNFQSPFERFFKNAPRSRLLPKAKRLLACDTGAFPFTHSRLTGSKTSSPSQLKGTSISCLLPKISSSHLEVSFWRSNCTYSDALHCSGTGKHKSCTRI